MQGTTLARPVLLGIAAFLCWLGVTLLVLLVAGRHLTLLSDAWVASFPAGVLLPAPMLAGGVASYFAGKDWVLSSVLAGASGILLLWLFAISGAWWSVVPAAFVGGVLALGSGYVAQRLRHRG